MLFDYAGAFHIHTEYSFDGTTGIKEIIAAARRSGLDFIVVTDHFRHDARTDGWEGWHDGVLVVVGEEISPRYNHYLALGLQTPVIAWKKSSDPQAYIDAVNRQGGLGLIAHPDHTGAPKFGVKAYPWKEWSVQGYAGISIWDLMTDWQEKLASPLAAAWAYLFPAWSLSGPKPETLARWDELSRERPVTGYGEIDNHNSLKRYWGLSFRIFPFAYAFTTIRTRLMLRESLSADARTARAQIYDALRAGRAYVAQERWRSARGFLFSVHDAEHAAITGEEFVRGRAPARLEVKLPTGHDAKVAVLCDGKPVKEEAGALDMDIETAGNYRVEVQQKVAGRYKSWIYSNPIRVR